MFIDASRQIAETLYFSFRCVDALQGRGLKYVFYLISHNIYNDFQRCVDLAAESLTGQSLLHELFTDCFKSELMETKNCCHPSVKAIVGFTDCFKSELMETITPPSSTVSDSGPLPIALNRN